MSFTRQGIVLNTLIVAGLMAALTGAIRRFAPGW